MYCLAKEPLSWSYIPMLMFVTSTLSAYPKSRTSNEGTNRDRSRLRLSRRICIHSLPAITIIRIRVF